MSKTIKLNKLKEQYEFACNEYVAKFCNKQDMDFSGWVGNQIGGVAYCNDFYFNFQDIVWDINSKQPKGIIIDWYYENIEEPEKSINYFSYTKGLRIKDLCNNVNNNLDNIEWCNHSEKIKHIHSNSLLSQRGSKNNKAILNEEKVAEIYKLKGKLSHKEIAAIYGVARNTITQIMCQINWKHVTDKIQHNP